MTASTCSGPACCTSTSSAGAAASVAASAARSSTRSASCPDGDTAKPAVQTQCRRAALGRRGEHRARTRPGRDIAAVAPRQHQRQPHRANRSWRPPRVGGIVAERQPHAAGRTGAEAHDAAAQHQIARRVVADGDIVAGQCCKVGIVQPDAVRAGQPALQQSLTLHLGHQAARPARVQRGLRTGFHQMRVHGDIVAVAQRAPQRPGCRAATLRRVRTKLHADAAGPSACRLHCRGETRRMRIGIERRRAANQLLQRCGQCHVQQIVIGQVLQERRVGDAQAGCLVRGQRGGGEMHHRRMIQRAGDAGADALRGAEQDGGAHRGRVESAAVQRGVAAPIVPVAARSPCRAAVCRRRARGRRSGRGSASARRRPPPRWRGRAAQHDRRPTTRPRRYGGRSPAPRPDADRPRHRPGPPSMHIGRHQSSSASCCI